MLPFDGLEHLVGDPDVRDDDVACLHLGRRQHQRQLRRAERNGDCGLDRVADQIRRISRHAGRQVHGDDGNARAVDVCDDRLEHPLERRLEAGAEDRVDDQVARRDLREVQFPGLTVDDLHDREAQATENLQVRPCIPADLRNDAEHEHRDVDAALVERPGDHEAVAPVVPAPAQHGDVALGEILEARLHRRDHLAAGVFHQDDGGNPDLLDGSPIGLAHLVAVQHPHSAGV